MSACVPPHALVEYSSTNVCLLRYVRRNRTCVLNAYLNSYEQDVMLDLYAVDTLLLGSKDNLNVCILHPFSFECDFP